MTPSAAATFVSGKKTEWGFSGQDLGGGGDAVSPQAQSISPTNHSGKVNCDMLLRAGAGVLSGPEGWGGGVDRSLDGSQEPHDREEEGEAMPGVTRPAVVSDGSLGWVFLPFSFFSCCCGAGIIRGVAGRLWDQQ